MTATEIKIALEAAAAKSARMPGATEAQIDFLTSLMAKAALKGGNATRGVEYILSDLEQSAFGLTKRGASNYIDDMKFWAN